jgi:hypothetical protein
MVMSLSETCQEVSSQLYTSIYKEAKRLVKCRIAQSSEEPAFVIWKHVSPIPHVVSREKFQKHFRQLSALDKRTSFRHQQ